MEYQDEIRTEIKIKFDPLDRFRILITGNALVEVTTKTENLPGECVSKSRAYSPKLFKIRKNQGGYGPKFNKANRADKNKEPF